MGSRNEDDDDEAVSGEIMMAEEKRRIAIREKNRGPIVGAIFSRLSRVPFFNVWLEKKVSTSRKVVKEEKGLFDDLADHERSCERLLDIDTLKREDNAGREAAATAAENKLAAEKRIAAARETDDLIYAKTKEFEKAQLLKKHEYELRKLEANYKIQLDPLESSEEVRKAGTGAGTENGSG
jgi:hypothetical protein